MRLISDPLRRALRTFLQSWTGTFLGLWAMSGVGAEGNLADLSDLSTIGRLALAAGIGALPAIVALAQNWAEDVGAIPAVLKAPASEGADPVPDPGNSVTNGLLTYEDVREIGQLDRRPDQGEPVGDDYAGDPQYLDVGVFPPRSKLVSMQKAKLMVLAEAIGATVTTKMTRAQMADAIEEARYGVERRGV